MTIKSIDFAFKSAILYHLDYLNRLFTAAKRAWTDRQLKGEGNRERIRLNRSTAKRYKSVLVVKLTVEDEGDKRWQIRRIERVRYLQVSTRRSSFS
jgi:hypothetical protein